MVQPRFNIKAGGRPESTYGENSLQALAVVTFDSVSAILCPHGPLIPSLSNITVSPISIQYLSRIVALRAAGEFRRVNFKASIF